MPALSQQLATLAGQWVLDPARSRVELTTTAMGLFRVRGRFGAVSGTGTVSPDGRAGGTLTLAAASLATGNTRRDTHLRSADFFDCERYPDITFTAETIRPASPGPAVTSVAVTGVLTVRGTARPLSFEAAVSVRGDGEAGLDTVVLVNTVVPVNRADFGLTWNLLGMTGWISTVTVQATFITGARS
jgi:polyisoprenoid-binding protein YceI